MDEDAGELMRKVEEEVWSGQQSKEDRKEAIILEE